MGSKGQRLSDDIQCGRPEILPAQPTAAASAFITHELRDMRADAWHDREDDAAAAAGAE